MRNLKIRKKAEKNLKTKKKRNRQMNGKMR
jgi:hypothetical protein